MRDLLVGQTRSVRSHHADVVDGAGVVPVVDVGETVVGGAEDVACAGTITALISGLVHLPGNATAVATPPITRTFITLRRSYCLS